MPLERHDPEAEVQRLLTYLGDLASRWGNYDGPDVQATIEADYAQTVDRLYTLGWNGVIQVDCMLPLEVMPAEFLRRNPYEANPTRW